MENMPQIRYVVTIAELAAIPLDLSRLPEWQPITPLVRVTAPNWPTREERTPLGPLPPATLTNRLTQSETHKADPVWDVAFKQKFTKKEPDPDAELKTPRGAVKPKIEALDKDEELRWHADTVCCEYHSRGGQQADHRGFVNDMATTYEELAANGLKSKSLQASYGDEYDPAAEIAESHLNLTPYCVRLEDEIMAHPTTGEPVNVPRYADAVYVANMTRRIEWEKWLDKCGPLDRAYFALTKSGETGIEAASKSRDADYLLELRRLVKTTWLKSHADLPAPDAIEFLYANTDGVQVIEYMNPAQLEQHRLSLLFGDEDPDPERHVLRKDDYPRPERDQYAYGYCGKNCVLPEDEGDIESHNGCSIDGRDLYLNDLAMWKWANREDIGYAGPKGLVHLDETSDWCSNPFQLKEDEEDE